VIYLDYNATTPVSPEVLQEMLPYFSEKFGNAASTTHLPGLQAKSAVDIARERVAVQLNGEPQEIIFTSGATEAINLAIKGIFQLYQGKGNHIITAKTEHKAVLDTCRFLETKGARITWLEVNQHGQINLEQLEQAMTPETILVAVMFANNETGVVQNISDIADIVHRHQSIFFCDATQAVGKIPVDVQRDGIDVLSLSAHKLYGPKGVGALYVRRKNPRVQLEPLLHGGGHERGWRSGTLNVPGIVGLGKAMELITFDHRTTMLRDLLESGLTDYFGDDISINGKESQRLPNTSNITFPFKAIDVIRHTQTKLAVATGSACTSAQNTPSHVLTAMGKSAAETARSIRFSIGKYTTEEEIAATILLLRECSKL